VTVLASRVLLRPRDLDATLSFYERGIGLHRAREFGRPPHRGVVLFLGGGALELTETPADEPPPPTPQGVRLWLQVPDLDVAVERAVAEGAPLLQPAVERPWGLLEATVTDPDGTKLVLVEVPEDHPLRRDVRDAGER
jgi:predicted enzyme related to lactoylglutathione lyase